MSSQFASLQVTPSETELVNTFIDAMARVYIWMTGGLLITAVVATFVASSDDLAARLFSNGFVFWAIIIAQFGLVLALSAAIHKMSPTMALGLFSYTQALWASRCPSCSSLTILEPWR